MQNKAFMPGGARAVQLCNRNAQVFESQRSLDVARPAALSRIDVARIALASQDFGALLSVRLGEQRV